MSLGLRNLLSCGHKRSVSELTQVRIHLGVVEPNQRGERKVFGVEMLEEKSGLCHLLKPVRSPGMDSGANTIEHRSVEDIGQVQNIGSN